MYVKDTATTFTVTRPALVSGEAAGILTRLRAINPSNVVDDAESGLTEFVTNTAPIVGTAGVAVFTNLLTEAGLYKFHLMSGAVGLETIEHTITITVVDTDATHASTLSFVT